MYLKDNYLTRDKSKIIKFIAVLLMINLHLFSFRERIKPYDSKNLFLLKDTPIEYFWRGVLVLLFKYFYLLVNMECTFKKKRIIKVYFTNINISNVSLLYRSKI